MLLTLINSCRSGGIVSCELPFTTKVTISPSISQTFLSWVSIFDLHQPVVCLSHSSYGMPGLAQLMNVLFWERRDFHVSFSVRYMSGNFCYRPPGSSMVDMETSSNIMKPSSPKQKRSTDGCSNFKSPETRQVQERLVSTLEHMQVPKWDRTRCPEE